MEKPVVTYHNESNLFWYKAYTHINLETNFVESLVSILNCVMLENLTSPSSLRYSLYFIMKWNIPAEKEVREKICYNNLLVHLTKIIHKISSTADLETAIYKNSETFSLFPVKNVGVKVGTKELSDKLLNEISIDMKSQILNEVESYNDVSARWTEEKGYIDPKENLLLIISWENTKPENRS